MPAIEFRREYGNLTVEEPGREPVTTRKVEVQFNVKDEAPMRPVYDRQNREFDPSYLSVTLSDDYTRGVRVHGNFFRKDGTVGTQTGNQYWVDVYRTHDDMPEWVKDAVQSVLDREAREGH